MKKALLIAVIGLFITCGIIAQTGFDKTMDKANDAEKPWIFNPKIDIDSQINYQMPTVNNGNEDFTKVSQGVSNVNLVSRALAGPAYQVVAQGSYAYVAAGGALLVYDCADPYNCILVGSIVLGTRTASSMIKYIYVKDNYVYVANDTEGFWIIDVTDPANPFKASQVDLQGLAMSVFVQDNFAYVSTGTNIQPYTDGGLWVIDVSDPLNPEITGSNTSSKLGYV